MKVRKSLVLMVMIALILGLTLSAGAIDSELRIKFGVLSHRDTLFGNYGLVMGSDYLFYLKDSPFSIVGGLEYIYSVRTIYHQYRDWRDIAATLSFLYYPTPRREVYLGMGLEYHWVIKGSIGLLNWSTGEKTIGDSGLGLHFAVGFNLGEYVFLEGKLLSVGIGYKNEGGISIQMGARI